MKKVLVIITILGLIAGSAGLYLVLTNKPISPVFKNQVFVINQGESVNLIGQRLKTNHLIKSSHTFLFYSYILGLNTKLQAGTFKLSPSLTTQETLIKLSKGGSHDYWLKIKDGSRIEEIAVLFEDNASITPKDFIDKAKTKEGYLFPDSYLVPQYFTVDQILDLINKNFSQKFVEAQSNKTNLQLSDKEIIILASLLEREGKSLESKQIIAGILLNRLDVGMPLQLDATVQFARDSKLPHPKTYWLPLEKSLISNIDSPFNTYKYQNLPPSPICNPGFNSIFAAYHPIKSDYIFYITGTDGQMHYAKTLAEHNQNIQKYLRAI